MPKNGKRNKDGLVDRLLSSGLVFGALVMLFMATMASVGMVGAADGSGEFLISIKDCGYPSDAVFLSPDWKKIAFSCVERTDNALYVMNSDGSNLRKLNDEPSVIHSWSPDGKKIAFFSYVGRKVTENLCLFTISSDGSNKMQLTEPGEYGFHCVWSPHGSKIAFTCSGGIFVANFDGSDRKLITSGRLLSFAPDGRKIIFCRDDSIVWEIDIDSGVLKKLINIAPASCIYAETVVSPDVGKIIFQHDGIWVANFDGSGSKQLTQSEYDRYPCWSPDSRRIAFISMEEGIRRGTWVMNSDGSDQNKIAESSFLAWSKDGSKIAYITFDRENMSVDIYTLSIGKPSPVKPPAGETPTEKQPGIPGFEAVFAIAGILMVAYLLRGRK